MDKIDVKIEIMLIYQNGKIIMKADKHVLDSFDFFHNIFNFGMSKNKTVIVKNVEDTKITHKYLSL